MNTAFVLLQAQAGGDYSFLIMMVAIFAIMYFFMIRPQNKKQKEIQNFRKNLEVGQEVITAGGIYGKVKEIEDNVVVLEIASGVKIRIDKNSIFANAAVHKKLKELIQAKDSNFTGGKGDEGGQPPPGIRICSYSERSNHRTPGKWIINMLNVPLFL